jgi:hypothetical protein
LKKIFDNLGSATWMGMDMLWMSNKISLAIMFMILSIIIHTIPPKKREDVLGYFVTLSWVMMNSAWMLDEVYHNNIFTVIKYTFLTIGLVSMIMIILIDIKLLKSVRRFK